MRVLMKMFWEGIKPDQYEKLRTNVNWEGNTPKGSIFHVSAFDERGIHVIDLWDSTEEFNSFIDKRLMPEVRKMGISDMPQVEVYNSYSTSVPEYNKIFGNVTQSIS